jgi:cytochrome-b5 reductase
MWRALAAAGIGAMFGGAAHLVAEEKTTHCASTKCAFSPDEFRSFRLISSRYETHDTRRFYFALPDKDALLNMPVSSCVVAKYVDADGKDVIRPYTPTSNNGSPGRFELIIKRYPKSKMGNHVFSLRPGEELQIKGPFQKFSYQANQWKHIGMIAGGTGITPMYQIINTVLENPKDKTELSLIYGNNSRRDIILATELCELQKTYSNFHLYITLLDVPKRWLGGIGFINQQMIKAYMPKPGEKDTKVLVCGPTPMMKHISGDKDFSSGTPQQGELTGLLKDLGYTPAQVFKF